MTVLVGSPYPSVELMHLYCNLLRAPCVPSHHLCIHLPAFSPFTVRSLGVKTVTLLVPGKGGFMMCINAELLLKGEEEGKGYAAICFSLLLENAGEQIDRKVDLLLQTANSFEHTEKLSRLRVRAVDSKCIFPPNLGIFYGYLVQWISVSPC